MEYIAPVFDSAEKATDFPVASIDSFHWEKDGYSRPVSFASMFAVENKGIHTLLWSFEENIRCECTKRDDPVYTDSCLEFFIMPVEGDNRYINIEVNPKGVFLSQIGEKRESRVFISEFTDLVPAVHPMEIEENGKKAWGCEIILSEEFISELYKTDYKVHECTVKGNFYKCGDLCESPHYGAHFPVDSDTLGFHNPDCFGKIILRKV